MAHYAERLTLSRAIFANPLILPARFTVLPAKERHPVPRYGAGIHKPLCALRALCGEP